LLGVGLALLSLPALVGVAAASAPAAAKVAFTINVPQIIESSSLAVSTTHPGLIYTANDSGDGPYVYVLNRQGRLVGTTTLAGVDPVDVEALSAGLDGSLVVGDIGDNDAKRSSVRIYQIPQPGRGDHRVMPKTVALTYPDEPRNAESLVYDAASGRVDVVSKELFAHVYRSPPHVFSHHAAMLTKVADAPMIATDATLLGPAHAVVVRTYRDAVICHYPSFRFWRHLDLPAQQMGESIAAVPGRQVVYAGSEGVSSPVWSVPLPPLAASAVNSGSVRTEPSSSAPTPAIQDPAAGVSLGARRVISVADEGSGWSPTAVVVTTGVLVVAAGFAVLLLLRRRP
jgi:hypothetical protein